MTGIELIAAERKRHTEVEGWTSDHDDGHIDGALVAAAAHLIEAYCDSTDGLHRCVQVESVPWGGGGNWLQDLYEKHGGIRALEIAGSLIAAEIDRRHRRSRRKGERNAMTIPPPDEHGVIRFPDGSRIEPSPIGYHALVGTRHAYFPDRHAAANWLASLGQGPASMPDDGETRMPHGDALDALVAASPAPAEFFAEKHGDIAALTSELAAQREQVRMLREACEAAARYVECDEGNRFAVLNLLKAALDATKPVTPSA